MTLLTKCIFEFLGTMVLILLGDGVCAATSLNKSKAQGAGWVVITLGWGFAVMVGVFISGSISGAHLNPAVSIGCALAGTMDWSAVPGYRCLEDSQEHFWYGCSIRTIMTQQKILIQNWEPSVPCRPSKATRSETSSARP